MRVKIVVNSGEEAGTARTVAPGQTLRVGRSQPSELRLPDDAMLSSVHFSLEVGPESCLINDLGSKFGTIVNGQKVQKTELFNGDKIEAGRTHFSLMIDGGVASSSNHKPLTEEPVTDEPMPAPLEVVASPLGAVQKSVLAYFQALASTSTVYGILDAAREPTILARLNKHGEQCQSLYEGDKGESLAPFGPWLVRLPGTSPLLSELIGDGWGKSWGVYLTSAYPFADIRKHFRQFLRVQLPDGRMVYFRYYDPRVLRTYLSTLTPPDAKNFYGNIQRFALETEDGNGILEYSPFVKSPSLIQLSE